MKWNIDAVNEPRKKEYARRIEAALKDIRKRKKKFGSPEKLISYLEGATGIHRTTFGRNLSYFALVSTHLLKFEGIENASLGNAFSSSVAQSEALAMALRLEELERDNAKLRHVLEGLRHVEKDLESKDLRDALSDTAMALLCVLERFQDIIEIDDVKGEIIDLSAGPREDAVVVGRDRARAFLRWVQNHRRMIIP